LYVLNIIRTVKIYERDIWKKYLKESHEIDLQKRHRKTLSKAYLQRFVLRHTASQKEKNMKETYKRDLCKRPVTETYEKDLWKRPMKETYDRHLWKRPMEETYERDLWKRPIKETYGRDQSKSPMKETKALCKSRRFSCSTLSCSTEHLQKRPTKKMYKRDLWKKFNKGLYDQNLWTRPIKETQVDILKILSAAFCPAARGGGLGSRPKKMYGERLGDGVEYHLMKPTPRR